jgi:gamma-glutamylcyclotransferase (GGCT)/AIG2-like uncharacterized protein YtfP
MSSNEQNHRLFVYGTLRNDPGNEKFALLAQQAAYVGKARAHGNLYDLGAYPGMVHSDQVNRYVVGEVYSLNPNNAAQTWQLLDEYEGCTETDREYDRRLIPVVLEDGRALEAWAYILRSVPETAVIVPGGDYLLWGRKKRSA